MLQAILNFLNSIPGEVWAVIVEVLVAAIMVSPVTAGFIKWFGVDSDKKKAIIAIAVSMLAGAIGYIKGVPSFAWWAAPIQGAFVFTINQPFYRLFWKSFMARLNELTEKAKALNAETRTAAQINGETNETVTAVDFSQ